MTQVSIKINIAGRSYPLTINKAEEQSVQKAAKMINEKVKELEKSYAITDKQDLLAMSSLQIAKQLAEIENQSTQIDESAANELSEIDSLLTDYLQKA